MIAEFMRVVAASIPAPTETATRRSCRCGGVIYAGGGTIPGAVRAHQRTGDHRRWREAQKRVELSAEAWLLEGRA